MTESESSEVIGDIAKELSEKRRLLACLEVKRRRIIEALSRIEGIVKGEFAATREPDGFLLRWPGSNVELVAYRSLASIHELLAKIDDTGERVAELKELFEGFNLDLR